MREKYRGHLALWVAFGALLISSMNLLAYLDLQRESNVISANAVIGDVQVNILNEAGQQLNKHYALLVQQSDCGNKLNTSENVKIYNEAYKSYLKKEYNQTLKILANFDIGLNCFTNETKYPFYSPTGSVIGYPIKQSRSSIFLIIGLAIIFIMVLIIKLKKKQTKK